MWVGERKGGRREREGRERQPISGKSAIVPHVHAWLELPHPISKACSCLLSPSHLCLSRLMPATVDSRFVPQGESLRAALGAGRALLHRAVSTEASLDRALQVRAATDLPNP